MEAKGESILDKALQTTGAGLEVGGAHWFALEGPEHTEAAQETSHVVDGKLKIQVSMLSLLPRQSVSCFLHNRLNTEISTQTLLASWCPAANM